MTDLFLNEHENFMSIRNDESLNRLPLCAVLIELVLDFRKNLYFVERTPILQLKPRSLIYAMETAVHSYFIYVNSYSASVVRTTADFQSSLSVHLISPH
jgi:hypothetical protein